MSRSGVRGSHEITHTPRFSAVVLWSLNSAWHFVHGAWPVNQRFMCRFPMCIHQARPRRACAYLHPIAKVHVRDCGHYHSDPLAPARAGREGYKKQQQKRDLTASTNAKTMARVGTERGSPAPAPRCLACMPLRRCLLRGIRQVICCLSTY